MKRSISMLAACIFMLPLALSAQTYTAQSGVSLLTGVTASATHTSGAVRLPNFSGVGTLNITESGITGSPSGCTVALKYQQNNATTPTAAVATIAFTPSTGTQQLNVAPSVPSGDAYVAVYSCSSTYPTAGSINISFSPVAVQALANTIGAGDPCLNPAVVKSNVSIAISTATTTQIVAISGTKATYVCGFLATFGASTTAQFEYGTSTNCTGTNALTGVMAPATGAVVASRGNGTLFGAPASNGLCIVSTGTGGINGQVSFVQQ